MRICIIGKYPPIQGGVSARTFRYAHALAERGHRIDVVTNAKEVRPPYRMLMGADDWTRCDADYGPGRVRVHWSDPVDGSQFHIPMASPFVSKLASLAATVCAENDVELVFSYYMEPYAVAGHLVSQMMGLPHVVKTAGSDAGRLWLHGQLQPLYDHIFRTAGAIVAGGRVAERLEAIGVERGRVRPDPEFTVSESLFSPEGAALDVAGLCAMARQDAQFAGLQWGELRPDIPYFGVYGKLGETKGTYALLRAIARLVENGRRVGLLVMGHGRPRSGTDFRTVAEELSLADHIVQIPFLPNWRVPEFIRRCLAVCCLEQDFPITFHAPIIPREVLTCGACLVGSAEVIRKLPSAERMVHGYNCLAIRDVNDVDELSGTLAAVLDAPDAAAEIGRRGRAYVVKVQKHMDFPSRIEKTLLRTVSGHAREAADSIHGSDAGTAGPFALTRTAVEAMTPEQRRNTAGLVDPDLDESDWAAELLSRIEGRVAAGETALAPFRDAVRLDTCIAEAMSCARPNQTEADGDGGLFRLDVADWSAYPENFRDLIPSRLPHVSVGIFDHDISAFLGTWEAGEFPSDAPRRETHAVVVGDGTGHGVRALMIDPATAALLGHCDGRLTLGEIATRVCASSPATQDGEDGVFRSAESLFETGLIGLRRAAYADAAAE